MNRFLICLAVFFHLIFPLKAQELIPPPNMALLKASVINYDSIPLAGQVFLFRGETNKKLFKGISDTTGYFKLLLPKGDVYLVQYQNYSQKVDYKKLEVPAKEGILIIMLNIKIKPAKVYTLENVFFDFNKATLRPESYPALNELYEAMKFKPELEIEIAGHTDNKGTPEYNLKLSQKRSEAVKNYLVKKGIAPNRITAQGYGESEPVADNDTDEGRQLNRRTEVRIIKE